MGWRFRIAGTYVWGAQELPTPFAVEGGHELETNDGERKSGSTPPPN